MVVVPVLLPLFGSMIELTAVAELVITVPPGLPRLTCTTIVNTAVSPLGELAFEKITLPVPPTGGELMLQPVPVVTAADTNVVFAGTASVTVVLRPGPGPALL